MLLAAARPVSLDWSSGVRLAVTDPATTIDMNIAAKAALKKRTGMTAADNDLGSTAMAGQAHAASTALAGPGVAAVAAPAAHSSGAYNFTLMAQASSSLPAAPAFGSSRGRPPLGGRQVDQMGAQGDQEGGGDGGRGRPRKQGNQFKCPDCPKTFAQQGSIDNYHRMNWTIMDSTTGESRQQRLCRTINKDLIAKLKATKERAARPCSQPSIQSAARATVSATVTTATRDCLTTHMKERVALTTKAKKAKKAMREKNSRLKKARAQKNETS